MWGALGRPWFPRMGGTRRGPVGSRFRGNDEGAWGWGDDALARIVRWGGIPAFAGMTVGKAGMTARGGSGEGRKGTRACGVRGPVPPSPYKGRGRRERGGRGYWSRERKALRLMARGVS